MATISDRQIPVEELAEFMGLLDQQLQSLPLTEQMQACAVELRKAFGRNFSRAGTEAGASWPARKRKQPAGRWEHPLLILSGDMFAAATSDFGAGNLTLVGTREVAVGVDGRTVPYAATHNYGDPNRNIAQREFAAPDEEALQACELLIGEAVYEQIG